jgi:hypothetical protein
MDNIYDLLKNRIPGAPPEIAIIKKYLIDTYDESATILVNDKEIIIKVSSAALANTLRLRARDIQKICHISKKLRFKIV